jgi:catechol 2,3-dioxygenase-like lactoylglutathione lyase family enzyme
VHLRLPACGDGGPTLELFQYGDADGGAPGRPAGSAATALRRADHPGFGHIAFEVDEVTEALDAVLRAGGSALGEVVTVQIAGAGTITWTYARDPEGNILELQRWERASAL